MAQARIREVGDGEVPVFTPEDKEGGNEQAVRMLLLLLKTMSQKTVVAIANLVTLAGLGTGFWLWLSIMPTATTNQLVGLGLYGMFVIGLRFVWRK